MTAAVMLGVAGPSLGFLLFMGWLEGSVTEAVGLEKGWLRAQVCRFWIGSGLFGQFSGACNVRALIVNAALKLDTNIDC